MYCASGPQRRCRAGQGTGEERGEELNKCVESKAKFSMWFSMISEADDDDEKKKNNFKKPVSKEL